MDPESDQGPHCLPVCKNRFEKLARIFSRQIKDKILPALVAQLDVFQTGDQEVWVQPPPGQRHSFVEIDHETFSMVILSLMLI